ncbi:DUF423 domain-containing protein [Thiohalorhabdus sp.]|uniref:DUF423 domain-containing protein n=1 Tax=Thiohalorhabdus sp. TaxID=3094134 RepID=UPI002FC36E0E
MTSARLFLVLGALVAALGVGLGAFGAHGLKERLSADMLAVFETGVRYHLVHALGLIAVALTAFHLGETGWFKGAGWVMVVGLVIFPGTLYALALGGPRWLGAVTPLGGTAFIVAWVLLAVAVLRA